ncbi:DUF3857 domain-containing protein [Spongiivirga citrea]|uniref:DUF3857 domain-containing protein n=1 Tax=Spongiivirga citrea TaxID=1481457 RepID=A0A6M0CLJ7_9FLAO|nr:DUF3857 domain-containing protein [Spongiivirga citrea]NER18806.1 DUF3857 domain-containing protein [Spongiivirga citrea]
MPVRNFPSIFFLLIPFICFSQFKVDDIPQELKDGANAIVLLDSIHVDITSRKSMTLSKKRIVTVLKEDGNSSVKAGSSYDPSTKIKSLVAYIYDKNGNEIKRIKKNDFKDVSAVDGGTLYGDSRVKYLDYTPTSYPYTVVFNTITQTSNTAFIPSWFPIDEYHISVAKSIYTINAPADLKLRTKEKNLEAYEFDKNENQLGYTFSMSNIKAEKGEQLSPAYYTIEPQVLFGLSNFHLEGVDGSAEDWKSMGNWQYQKLLLGRDFLPPETIQTITNLVKDEKDTKAKARKIYKYVQDNTRYISVQLGIGGWMPITAKEVDNVKYGDCKGLTNYTKALLKSQGIDAYYSVVYAGNRKKSMESDFASMQGNHVILNVPIDGEDIWLECTSQTTPFGFLGDFTDDRDVLVVKPEGGEIKRTASYIDKDNSLKTTANYKLNKNGSIEGRVTLVSKGMQYDNRYYRVSGLDDEKKEKYYKNYWSNIGNLKIKEASSLGISNPFILGTETIELSATSFARITDEGIIFQINPFNANTFVPDRYKNRKQPFEIARGYEDTAEYTIALPEGFSLEQAPTPVSLETKYGSYQMTIEKKGENKLSYKRTVLIKKGLYPKEEYNDYRNFRRKVAKNDKLKLLLKQ